jgi:hypothetical protein
MAAKTIVTNMNMFSALKEDAVSTTSTQVIEDEEFPALSTQSNKKPKKAKPTKFIVASSYIDELKHRAQEQRQQRFKPQEDGRSKAFAQMQDKEKLAKTLTCTKPCQYVMKKIDEETGVESDYGVCYREICTFAHSMAELQLPPCAFGDKCNRRNGTKDFKTGQVDKIHKCQFCHPGESADQFYSRTGRDKPDLPATSEKSHQPKPKAATKKDDAEAPVDLAPTQELKRCNAMGQVQMKALVAIATKPVQVDKEDQPAMHTETTVIRVPKELAQQAMEMALSRGLADFRIELI